MYLYYTCIMYCYLYLNFHGFINQNIGMWPGLPSLWRAAVSRQQSKQRCIEPFSAMIFSSHPSLLWIHRRNREWFDGVMMYSHTVQHSIAGRNIKETSQLNCRERNSRTIGETLADWNCIDVVRARRRGTTALVLGLNADPLSVMDSSSEAAWQKSIPNNDNI